MKTLNVDIKEQNTYYPIIIGENLNDNMKNMLDAVNKAVLVTNETIFEIYREKLSEIFGNLSTKIEYCIIPDGEVYKSDDTLKKILTCAFENHLERKDMFIAFGGGVVGDITGFASSIYLRGINFIQIPTTILAQVDSSVGGKVAIDTPYGKNMIGAFYHPVAVITDVTYLKTLPEREILSGLSEVVKYAFIEKNCGLEFSDFAKFLSDNSKKLLSLDVEQTENMIEKCCELKAAVVNQDAKEQGLRAVLNFGHTIGHALEKVTNYKMFTHGEAVAIGMKAVISIALKLNIINKEVFDFYNKLLRNLRLDNFKIPLNITVESILQNLKYDKKVKNGSVRFVLPVDYGKVEFFDNLQENIIREVLQELYRL